MLFRTFFTRFIKTVINIGSITYNIRLINSCPHWGNVMAAIEADDELGQQIMCWAEDPKSSFRNISHTKMSMCKRVGINPYKFNTMYRAIDSRAAYIGRGIWQRRHSRPFSKCRQEKKAMDSVSQDVDAAIEQYFLGHEAVPVEL